MKFFDLRPFFSSGVVVSQNLIPIGFHGTLYDPLECWKTIVKPLEIKKSSIETFGLMSAFLAFMALRVKFLQLADFFCQNGHYKVKKL